MAPVPRKDRGGQTAAPEGSLGERPATCPGAPEPGTCEQVKATPTPASLHGCVPAPHSALLVAGPREDRPLGERRGSFQTPSPQEGDSDSHICLVSVQGLVPRLGQSQGSLVFLCCVSLEGWTEALAVMVFPPVSPGLSPKARMFLWGCLDVQLAVTGMLGYFVGLWTAWCIMASASKWGTLAWIST